MLLIVSSSNKLLQTILCDKNQEHIMCHSCWQWSQCICVAGDDAV